MVEHDLCQDGKKSWRSAEMTCMAPALFCRTSGAPGTAKMDKRKEGRLQGPHLSQPGQLCLYWLGIGDLKSELAWPMWLSG